MQRIHKLEELMSFQKQALKERRAAARLFRLAPLEQSCTSIFSRDAWGGGWKGSEKTDQGKLNSYPIRCYSPM